LHFRTLPGFWDHQSVAYELGGDETVADAVRRSAQEQLERALAELRDGIHSDPVAAVHTARKSIKKERALLRLARGGLSRDQRRADNATLRDAARNLSGLRDAEVMLQALHGLSERYAGQLNEAVVATVRQKLEQGRESAHERAAQSEAVAEAIQTLDGLAARVPGWDLKADGWRAIEPGLQRTYRDGRAAFRLARREPSPENLHEWRKRVKDFWYDARLLAPVCGPVMRGQAEELEYLSELLGDEHDLAVLKETVKQLEPDASIKLAGLIGLIDQRRDQLQTQAMLIGRRLYGERPRAFVRRVRRFWKAGRERALAEAAVDQPINSLRPKTRSNASSSP
jgi:CHAD domain-containing protein